MNGVTTMFWCGNRLVQRTLSIFFYAKQFNSGCNEKLGMNKLPCKELTLSLFLQISPPPSAPSLSLILKLKVKKITSHNSGEFI